MLVIMANSSHGGKVMIFRQSLTMEAQKLRGISSFDSKQAWPVVQKFCYYLRFQLYKQYIFNYKILTNGIKLQYLSL